jgi:hypothetical protein
MSKPSNSLSLIQAVREQKPAIGLGILILAGVGLIVCRADDIKTLDGKTYLNVTNVKVMPNEIVFPNPAEPDISRIRIPFSNLPDELKKKYNYDPFEEGFYMARLNRPTNLKLNFAYRLANLEAAKKQAKDEKKLIGFIMVWDSMFRPAQPMGRGGPNDLAGFYTVFNGALVLVFVRHEDELDKVPDAVKKGFNGPEEGGWAPNMAVVTEDCSQFVCEIPLGGERSDGIVREQVFKKKIAEIRAFQHKRTAAK